MSNSRPRILYVCSRVPYDEFSGFNMRVRNTLRILNRHYDVDLVCLSHGKVDDSNLAGLRQDVRSVSVFPITINSIIKGIVGAVISGRPIQSGIYVSPQLSEWIADNGNRYQMMICHLMRTTEYGNYFPGPKIAELNDSISRHYSSGRNVGTLKWRAIRRIEAGSASRYEGEILRRFDTAFMQTESDRQFALTAHPHGKGVLKLSSFGIPEEFELEPPSHKLRRAGDPYVIQFVGKMDYEPNVDAATYFANEIFPLVRAILPAAQFHIVGDRPSGAVRKLTSSTGVIVTGRVSNLVELVRSADVSVIPMRFGGGIQTKALQATSQKLPVVMSSVAARGIEGVNGVHYLVADGVERTANAIARIHGNPELASTLGVNARELVMAKYLWSSVEEQLIADIEQLVSPAGK